MQQIGTSKGASLGATRRLEEKPGWNQLAFSFILSLCRQVEALSRSYFLFQFFLINCFSSISFFCLFFFGKISLAIAFPCQINRINSAARRPIVLSTKCKIRDTSFGNDVGLWWNDQFGCKHWSPRDVTLLESPNHRMPNPRWLGRKTETEKNCCFEENEQEPEINRNNLISDRSYALIPN